MESSSDPVTPAQASATLAAAEAARSSVAHRVTVPRFFLASIGAGVAVQVATTAVGLGSPDASGWVIAAGLAAFAAVAVLQLAHFTSLNGVWLGGLVSRVVGGTAIAASLSYAASLAGAVWAAFSGTWWLVVCCAVAGGTGYAVSGSWWLRRYRCEPAVHGRGESAGWLALLAVLGTTGLVLLVPHR